MTRPRTPGAPGKRSTGDPAKPRMPDREKITHTEPTKACHAIRDGRDDSAEEWIRRAGETKPQDPPPFRSPQSRIDAALVSIRVFLEAMETDDENPTDSPLVTYVNRTQARRLREIQSELRGER